MPCRYCSMIVVMVRGGAQAGLALALGSVGQWARGRDRSGGGKLKRCVRRPRPGPTGKPRAVRGQNKLAEKQTAHLHLAGRLERRSCVLVLDVEGGILAMAIIRRRAGAEASGAGRALVVAGCTRGPRPRLVRDVRWRSVAWRRWRCPSAARPWRRRREKFGLFCAISSILHTFLGAGSVIQSSC